MKPCQQVHVKPPTVLMHVLLAPQLSVPLTHSLMSMLQCGPSNLNSNASDTGVPADRGLLKGHVSISTAHVAISNTRIITFEAGGPKIQSQDPRCMDAPGAWKAIDKRAAASIHVRCRGWLGGAWLLGLARLGVQVVHILADEIKGRVILWVDPVQPLPCMAPDSRHTLPAYTEKFCTPLGTSQLA